MDKLDFLQKQNKQLREEIQQLKQIHLMNKIQIDILSKQLQGNSNSKKLMDVIFAYRQREDKLQNMLNNLKKQIIQLSFDNLVLRQLTQGQNIQIKNMQNFNLQSIQVLNRKIKEMQDKIAFYQKSHKQYDKISGFVLKNRDIVGPQDLALQLKNKQQQWKDQLQVMRCEVEQFKKNQQNLMVINTVLRNRIVSLQAQLAMPNRNLGEVLDKSLKKLMLYFIEIQKKIVTGQQDSQTDSQNDIELIAPQLSGLFPQKMLKIQKNYGVPHIDLLKIRQQMNHSSNKIKQALIARNHLTDRQKIQRLQIQLEYTRREFSRNIIDLRAEVSKRKKGEILITEMQERMTLLINSNKHLETKMRKYWEKLKSEKQKIYGLSDNQETGKGLFQEEVVQNLAVPEEMVKKESKKQKKKNELINPSFLANEHEIDYRIHLQIMAKQLQKNSKLKKLQRLQVIRHENNEHEVPKIKRCSSNPLLYFNQRKSKIMSIKNIVKEDQSSLRLQQTYYAPRKNINYQEIVIDIE